MKCRHCKASLKDRKALMAHRWRKHRGLMHAGRHKAGEDARILRAGGPASAEIMLKLLRNLPNEITLGAARQLMSSAAATFRVKNPLKA